MNTIVHMIWGRHCYIIHSTTNWRSECIQYNTIQYNRVLQDRRSEARACSNIANVMKAVGQFEEAIMYTQLQLDIAKEIEDVVW